MIFTMVRAHSSAASMTGMRCSVLDAANISNTLSRLSSASTCNERRERSTPASHASRRTQRGAYGYKRVRRLQRRRVQHQRRKRRRPHLQQPVRIRAGVHNIGGVHCMAMARALRGEGAATASLPKPSTTASRSSSPRCFMKSLRSRNPTQRLSAADQTGMASMPLVEIRLNASRVDDSVDATTNSFWSQKANDDALHPRRRAAIASMSAAKSAKGKPRTDCEGAAAANTAASRDQRTSKMLCECSRRGSGLQKDSRRSLPAGVPRPARPARQRGDVAARVTLCANAAAHAVIVVEKPTGQLPSPIAAQFPSWKRPASTGTPAG